jgi:hypothetical protein
MEAEVNGECCRGQGLQCGCFPFYCGRRVGLDADFNRCKEGKSLLGHSQGFIRTVALHPHGARRATVDRSPHHMKAAYSVLGIRSRCDLIGVEGDHQKGG